LDPRSENDERRADFPAKKSAIILNASLARIAIAAKVADFYERRLASAREIERSLAF
jgi:hypothetical protein